MAIKNTALTVNILAWDTALNTGKTGDSANISLQIIKDGGSPTSVTNSITEPTSANMPGVYEIALTSTEMNADFITVGGKSSTTSVVIFPIFIQTEQGKLAIIDASTSGTNTLIGALNDISTSEVDTTITNNTLINTINSNTSGTDTLIGALNDISTSDVDTTITNNTLINTINSNTSGSSDLDTIITNNTLINTINSSTSGTDTLIGALNDISTSDVKTQIDTAISVDTISELTQGIPSATPTLVQAVMLQHMDLRNKRTATSSEYGIYNDAGTRIAKATLSDDGTTFTKAELVSGA